MDRDRDSIGIQWKSLFLLFSLLSFFLFSLSFFREGSSLFYLLKEEMNLLKSVLLSNPVIDSHSVSFISSSPCLFPFHSLFLSSLLSFFFFLSLLSSSLSLSLEKEEEISIHSIRFEPLFNSFLFNLQIFLLLLFFLR